MRTLQAFIARSALAAGLALGGLGCGTSRPTGSDGYTVRDDGGGRITIAVGENASLETLTAALTAAARLTAWVPPETAPHLTRVERTDMGASGIAYRYRMDHAAGRFDVYVYQYPGDVDVQIAETQQALAQLAEEGRIDRFTVVQSQKALAVTWNDQPATLYRVIFGETFRGVSNDSYMYMIKDDIFWIKARVSVPAGQMLTEDVDALVRGLLGA